MDEIVIEGCRIRVRLDGPEERPALVLAHMLGTDLTLWDALVPELAKVFRVVRLDARGHGGSEIGASGLRIDRLGGDVVAVLDHLGIARAHFCGLSMGGAVGLWLLANAGDRFGRAVIAGAAAKFGTPGSWNERIAAARAGGMEQAVPSTLERWFRPAFREREPNKVEAVAGLIRATGVEGYASCCAALRDMDLREAVRGIAHPVLVLRGIADPSASEDDARFLVEAMENATVQELAASHCACVEDEGAFLSAVIGFLTAKAAPRRAPVKRIATKRGPVKAASAKPGTRRVGARGLTAARQPVARTAPVSQKAVAKAGATRKTAARKTATRKTAAGKSPGRTSAPRVEPARGRAPVPARSAGAATAWVGTTRPSRGSAKATARPAAVGSKAQPATPKSSTPKSPKFAASRSASSGTRARKPIVRSASPKAAAVKPALAKPGRATKPTMAKPVSIKSAVGAKPASTRSRSAGKVADTSVRPGKAAAGKAKATSGNAKATSGNAKAKSGKTKLSAAQLRARRGRPAGRRKP